MVVHRWGFGLKLNIAGVGGRGKDQDQVHERVDTKMSAEGEGDMRRRMASETSVVIYAPWSLGFLRTSLPGINDAQS